MKTPLGYAFKAKLNTITPLHIGGNGRLSPLTDYYVKDNRINVIDNDALSSILLDRGMTNNFVTAVEQAASESKETFLEEFLVNHLSMNIGQLPMQLSLSAIGVENPVLIERFMETQGMPYIPGSSIKGALRSALLFSWLLEEKGKKSLRSWLGNLRRQKENLRSYSRDQLNRNRQKALKEIAKSFSKDIEEDDQCFGSIRSRSRMPLSSLVITDTSTFNRNQMAVYGVKRFNLSKGTSDIPTMKECILPDQRAEITISLGYSWRDKRTTEEHYNHFIKQLTDEEAFLRLVNQYSQAVLDYEIEASSTIETTSLSQYRDNLQNIRERIRSAVTTKAFFRLGQGKMQYYQTIAMAVLALVGNDKENTDWLFYLDYCKGFDKDSTKHDIYPVTRALALPNHVPLGWVEINLHDPHSSTSSTIQ